MTSGQERFPDIEIYVSAPDLDKVEAWLESRFDVSSKRARGKSTAYELALGNEALECLVVADATRDGFTSVWFKSNRTPWPDDRSCAMDAHEALAVEVRCSTGSWAGDGEDTWLAFRNGHEHTITWSD